MKNIYLQLFDHQSDNLNLVLATVTSTQGSTPQKPGSSAIFGEKGLISGTVGGGVVEGRVQKLAMEAIKSKKSGHFRFNLANEITKSEEAICGGQISILIDANPNNHISVFELVLKSIEKRIPGVLITLVNRYSEETVHIDRFWISNTFKPVIPKDLLKKIEPVAIDMLSGYSSDYKEMESPVSGEQDSPLVYLESVYPPAHLIIAGAGHIGKSLAHFADMLDFEVTVIDDRPEYANSENIPEADHIIVKDIGEALKDLKKRNDNYVVIVTRGHKDDAAALRPCLGSDLAYTGMIGSKNKIAAMRKSFIENGWATIDQWAKIHSPVGLAIKSRTVEEIALSIAAELVLVRNSKE